MEILRQLFGLTPPKNAYEVYLERAKDKGPLIIDGTTYFRGSYFKELSKEDEHSIDRFSKDAFKISLRSRIMHKIYSLFP